MESGGLARHRMDNRPMRLEGAIRLLGAIALALAMGLITYLVLDLAVGGQAATLAAAAVFIATAGAFGWAFR
jgi:hypothetical protein